jgi:PhnB protein
MSVKPIPEGYHSVTPYLLVDGVEQAIEFYKKAFGAVEHFRLAGPDGKVCHAEIRIGDSNLMVGQQCPEMGMHGPKGSTPVSLVVYVADADALAKQAVGAGATTVTPVADMMWGDRMGKFNDPFGHQWSLATHVEDVSPEVVAERFAAFFKKAS